jgi:hypothetical protein
MRDDGRGMDGNEARSFTCASDASFAEIEEVCKGIQ